MSGRLTNRVKSSGAGSLLVAMLCLGALLLGINLLSSSQAFGADAGLTRVEQTDTRLVVRRLMVHVLDGFGLGREL